MTVRQLLAEMDSRELSEWLQFDTLEAEDAKRRALESRLAVEAQSKLANRPRRKR